MFWIICPLDLLEELISFSVFGSVCVWCCGQLITCCDMYAGELLSIKIIYKNSLPMKTCIKKTTTVFLHIWEWEFVFCTKWRQTPKHYTWLLIVTFVVYERLGCFVCLVSSQGLSLVPSCTKSSLSNCLVVTWWALALPVVNPSKYLHYYYYCDFVFHRRYDDGGVH